ncbi:MAG: hypothetical protein ACE5KE_15905 [Methanosarcinales archaeon]
MQVKEVDGKGKAYRDSYFDGSKNPKPILSTKLFISDYLPMHSLYTALSIPKETLS